MSPLTTEWVDKAEGDFVVASRELRARRSPNYDAACFHTQQCIEKYLKARLTEANLAFPLTHNLTALLNLLLPIEPNWASLQPDLLILTNYAVFYRYPGSAANRAEARDALRRCRRLRALIRSSLGLPTS